MKYTVTHCSSAGVVGAIVGSIELSGIESIAEIELMLLALGIDVVGNTHDVGFGGPDAIFWFVSDLHGMNVCPGEF